MSTQRRCFAAHKAHSRLTERVARSQSGSAVPALLALLGLAVPALLANQLAAAFCCCEQQNLLCAAQALNPKP
jgi:hypothetical protein